jgi:hypothetical protein
MDSGTSTGDWPKAYGVFVSNDGLNWTGPVGAGAGSSAMTSTRFPRQNARFIEVRQTATKSNWWTIREFNVYDW